MESQSLCYDATRAEKKPFQNIPAEVKVVVALKSLHSFTTQKRFFSF
jgi:hypothetical protein